MEEISVMVDKEIYKQRRHINVPKAILKPVAEILNKVLWWHTLSADEVEREFLDQVIDPKAKTFKDLGIEPGDIINFTYHYLVSAINCWAVNHKLTPHLARIPKPELLRSPPCDREGEAGREEVHPRLG
jgi:NADH dehydrogenase (ubiquinone) 1 alpha subcomplex subunit 9